ncbi:HemN-related non-iron pseudo-SAM protein PsgB [Borrelia anserina]|uniref:Oxygen-independent coproporphyrinogen-III oxidase n=2 Tax=Borrelia anserina TaxID=143 RepID=W5SNZ6_BORAN|nr:HemN-related non-iron pseudo-SAM protein PsgB [Borrelia anserina]AHH08625.1 Oxygen-independent coproporphyrinogen-III oxidase [Borrelia anserina BA2]APR65085.1 HemN-related non-iron pseudo-SAM protein PsgB [Borrelia anserina Es]UPA07012.1 HemN-related non-iron pseudo-SAM protein PsgB [Borrelia anserina]
MNFLCLSDLSIYIDLTRCLNYVFFDKILKELSYYLKVLGFSKIKTLYIKYYKYETLEFGNGFDLKYFLISLSENFDFSKLDEFTFELHPGEITPSLLTILNDFSVSRISLDIKSFSSKFLRIMGASRIPMGKLGTAIDNIHRFNFDLNIDLNVNIPYQEKIDLKKDLVSVIACAPGHVCLSEVLIDEGHYIFNNVSFNYDEAKAEDFWFYAVDFLQSNGYMNYEISNFALKGHESKHNLRYWALKPYLGLGLNSVSLLIAAKGDGLEPVIRRDDDFLGNEEASAVFESLSDLDFFICHFITNLGTKTGLDVSVLKRRFIYDQKDFGKFIDYLLSLSKAIVFSNDILYLDGHERFKLNFYLRLIREYLVNTSFKVNFKLL